MKLVGAFSGRVLVSVLFIVWLLPHAAGQIPDTWQPIPKEDLALKDNPSNPGSAAMILERQIYTDDEKRVQKEWIRIKVFTEEGRSYADVQIPYLGKSVTVEDIRGRTVRSDGTEIPFNGAIFDNMIVKYKRFRFNAKTFTLPGVESGSVIEYVYTMRWREKLPDYVRNPRGYFFQEAWTVPSTTWTLQQGLFTRHSVFVLKPVKSGHIGWAKLRFKVDARPSSQPDGTLRMEVADVPALEKEDYMPPESMLTSRVHLYYEVGFVSEHEYWRNWGKMRAQNAEKFVEKTKFLEREANDIAPASEPAEARLRKLYARVQQIRYLSYETAKSEGEIKREHLAANKSAEDVYRHGYAYTNEINFLFTALARSAGFDANIVEIVSRDSGLFEREVLDGTQFNGMVVLVRLNGKSLFFDPATRFCPYGMVPWYETDTTGVAWDKNGGEIVKPVAPTGDASTIERKAELTLQADGALEGNLEVEFSGQEAMELRTSAADEDDGGRKKIIEDTVKRWATAGTTVDVGSVNSWTDAEQSLKIQCHIRFPRFAILSRRRIVLPASVFHVESSNPVPQSYRVEPVYFAYGHSEVDKVTIFIPPGYLVEATPGNVDYQGTIGTLHCERTNHAGTLRLNRQSVRSGYFFATENYKSLRQYYEQLRQIDAQSVVLRREEAAQSKQ